MRIGTLLQNKKGAALIFVIVVLVVTTVMVGMVAFVVGSNTSQAGGQEKGIQAYYIARSGAELAYEAIYSNTALHTTITNNPTYSRTQNDVDMVEGFVNITVTRFLENGVTRGRIRSTGRLKTSPITRPVVLEFDLADGGNLRWEQ